MMYYFIELFYLLTESDSIEVWNREVCLYESFNTTDIYKNTELFSNEVS